LRTVQTTHEGDYVWTKKGVDINVSHLKAVIRGLGKLRDSFATGLPTEIIQQAKKRRIYIYASPFRSDIYVHVRRFYFDDLGNEWRPGRGISVKFEQLDELIEALSQL